MKTESKVLSIVAGFASAIGAAFATAAQQLTALSLQSETGVEPAVQPSAPKSSATPSGSSTVPADESPVIQACLRGTTVHFQVGAGKTYRKFDRNDLSFSDRDSIADVINKNGPRVTTSMYGSSTKYVKLAKVKRAGKTYAALPNGRQVEVPAFALTAAA